MIISHHLMHGRNLSHSDWGTQVVGRLADKPPAEGRPLAGLLVRHGYADSLMHPADLPLFTKLRPGRILQRQAVACAAPFSEAQLDQEYSAPQCMQCQGRLAYNEHGANTDAPDGEIQGSQQRLC